MTPDQLSSAYQESFRQEARGILMTIHSITIPKAGRKGEAALMDLQYTAFPPDPDTDDDFDKDSINEIKGLISVRG